MKVLAVCNDYRFENQMINGLKNGQFQIKRCMMDNYVDISKEAAKRGARIVIFHPSYPLDNVHKVIEKLVYIDKMVVIYVSDTSSEEYYDLANESRFVLLGTADVMMIGTVIDLMFKNVQRVDYLEHKLIEAETKIKEDMLVRKAKRELMKQGLTEDEAHKYIGKEAMEKRVSKGIIAKQILKEVE